MLSDFTHEKQTVALLSQLEKAIELNAFFWKRRYAQAAVTAI